MAPSDLAALNKAIGLAMDLRYERAIGEFSRLAGRFEAAGDRARTAEVKFWIGYCYEKQGRRDEAAAFYRSVVEHYPDTPGARQAERRLGGSGVRPSPSGVP